MVTALPLSAADFVLAGRLEGLTHTSISIRKSDGRTVDAALRPGTAVPYSAADQVEMDCTPLKTVYDSQAGLHYHLLVRNLRLVRTATPQERAEVMALLSWRPGENLLYRPVPVATSSPAELERVRRINLEYVSKMPNFVADETAHRYRSESAGKPWHLYDTVEDEITFKGYRLDRQKIRQNGKPFPGPYVQLGHQLFGGGFGLELSAVFEPTCPTTIEFAGTETAGGVPLSVYRYSSPPNGCFGNLVFGSLKNEYNPARTGRILVDARGNVLRFEEGCFGFPEKFGTDRSGVTESWDYVKIGDATHLLPVSAEAINRASDGASGRVVVEYKNHRHFEASTSITFGKQR